MVDINKIHLGDCHEVLSNIDDSCVDLVCFSPPYDAIRDYNGFNIRLNDLGKDLYRVTKDGGVCACVINDGTKDFQKSLTTFRLAVDWVDNAGWKLFETCIYSRHGKPGGWWNQRFRVDHEYILIFFKGTRPKFFSKKHLMIPTKKPNAVWSGSARQTDGTLKKVKDAPINDLKCRGTIWHYNTSNLEANKIKLRHPGTFPDALASDIIKTFSEEGGVVLDPTVGSGTTAVIAKKLNRNFIGIDISEDYVKIANERLLEETGSIFNDE